MISLDQTLKSTLVIQDLTAAKKNLRRKISKEGLNLKILFQNFSKYLVVMNFFKVLGTKPAFEIVDKNQRESLKKVKKYFYLR